LTGIYYRRKLFDRDIYHPLFTDLGYIMMKSLIFAVAITLTASAALQAQSTITDIDFDVNDPEFGFGFSGNMSADVPITYSAAGVGATGEGGVFSIDAGGPYTSNFAGGGLAASMIDLAAAGFTAGAITVSDLDMLLISFDMSHSAGGVNNLRFQPTGGGFSERINIVDDVTLAANAGTGFVNYNIAMASLAGAQKQTLVDTLNAGNETTIGLQFSFIGSSNEFAGGEFIAFDNISVTTAAIPEPGSLSLLSLLSVFGLARRKRS